MEHSGSNKDCLGEYGVYLVMPMSIASIGELRVALELAQGYLTTYRHMAIYDAIVDALGVMLGLTTAWTLC